MSKRANLAAVLADSAGSTRRVPEPQQPAVHAIAASPPRPSQLSRVGTVPITAHMPKAVRDQIKILAVEQSMKEHELLAEAFNDLFAKYGKPEIAPRRRSARAGQG
jgi:hypothetical protein